MRSPFRFLGALAVAAAIVAGIPAVAQTAQFIPMDVKCGPVFMPVMCAIDMSGDGNTVLFQDRVWNASTGYTMIGGTPGTWEARAISDDGSTVVGNVVVPDDQGGHIEAAIWRGGDQWQALGGAPDSVPCGGYLTEAYDISGDGSKVVGLAYLGAECTFKAHAFSWTAGTGIVDLGSIVPTRASRANAVSADGDVLVGWSDQGWGGRAGAKWDHGAAPQWFLPPSSKIFAGEAQGVSSDGTFIVGGQYNDNTYPRKPSPQMEPWLWSAATGMVHLGSVKGLRGDIFDGQHYARDVSDDGTVVVGQDTLFNLGEQWAFIWTKAEGIKALQDWLRTHGDATVKAQVCSAQRGQVPCHGWDFWNTGAVSNDGKTIIGTGVNPDGVFQAFMIKIQ